jgi:hypothetical protein
MSAIITFDDSLWPLLILRVQGASTDQQLKDYQARARSYLERGEKYVTISDLRQTGMMTPTQRRMQAEFLEENAAAMRERLLGNATIISSAPLRLAVSLIMPFKQPPMPYAVVADMDAAVRYALRRLEESGLGEDAERIQHLLEQRNSHLG